MGSRCGAPCSLSPSESEGLTGTQSADPDGRDGLQLSSAVSRDDERCGLSRGYKLCPIASSALNQSSAPRSSLSTARRPPAIHWHPLGQLAAAGRTRRRSSRQLKLTPCSLSLAAIMRSGTTVANLRCASARPSGAVTILHTEIFSFEKPEACPFMHGIEAQNFVSTSSSMFLITVLGKPPNIMFVG